MFGKRKEQIEATTYMKDKKKLASLLIEAESKAKNSHHKKGFVKETWDDLHTLLAMLKAYVKGDYKYIPYSSLALIVGAILYFVMPIDSIPDILAVVGLTDDAALIALTMKKIKGDLDRFVIWQDEQVEITEVIEENALK